MFLIHMVDHLRVGIGLQHVFNWVMYAANAINGVFWKEMYQPTVQMLGMEAFVCALIMMEQIYPGMPEENRSY